MKVNTPDAAIFPLLKVVPSSDVTVCANPSLFVQVIFVPAFTLSVAGLNVNPEIFTVPDDVPPVGGVLPYPLPVDLPQEIAVIIIKVVDTENKIFLILIKGI